MEKDLKKISRTAYRDEDDLIAELKNYLRIFPAIYTDARNRAEVLVTTARKARPQLFDIFMQNYPLTSAEGRALMVMAEALPRIPDMKTREDLVYSVARSADWKNKETDIFGEFSNTILKTVSKLSDIDSAAVRLPLKAGIPIFQRVAASLVERLSKSFILAKDIDEALKRAAEKEAEGFLFSYDMLGESARSEKQCEKYQASYLEAIRKVGRLHPPAKDWREKPGVSVKLSALYHRYDLLHEREVFANLMPRLLILLEEAEKYNLLLTIDAEDSSRFDLYLKIFKDAFATVKTNYDGFGLALQAYQKRAFPALDFLIALAKENGRSIPIRLVKGAYWDSEIKSAQVNGIKNYPVFTSKNNTDISYIACAKKMLDNTPGIYPQFATHNAMTLEIVREMAAGKKIEMQKLHGMGDAIYDMVKNDMTCRIYAPIGSFEELLPYLIRRILENGANSSFVHKLAAEKVDIDDILASPLDRPSYTKPIPLPAGIYSNRQNSHGFDLGNASELEDLYGELKRFDNEYWRSFPIIGGEEIHGMPHIIAAPYNSNRKVGDASDTSPEDIEKAIGLAQQGFKEWSGYKMEERAKIIERCADLLEKNYYELVALLMQEAGRTLGDSIAEVREAVDFCRYYAERARKMFGKALRLEGPAGEYNELRYNPRGVFLCISPWNFPLAIFLGQVAAALAAGNSVIAKPAEQTPIIAYIATKLFHKAGLPANALQLILGAGEKAGAALTASPYIDGVVFTGSTETAHLINKTLAEKKGPIVPFIAETGGQNAMIVDSSALLEQTADNIIRSAFGSSGQRCSSLRVLYVQEEVADNLLEILTGALASYKLGSPLDLSNDTGPVIDGEAEENLLKHIEKMRSEAKVIFDGSLIKKPESGYFVPPYIFEIDSIAKLTHEVFGPVLHLIRFNAELLEKVIEDINSTNFGLTFGVETRLEARAEYLSNRITAGNIYVNRSQIGAVVGTQPFGGEKLSGTGFKAGGPNYLLRFVTERIYSVNTSAIGGDVNLLT